MNYTIKQISQLFKQELEKKIDSREIDQIQFLVFENVLHLNRTQVISDPEKEIEKEKVERIETIISRLKNQEPIQYILGETEFYGLKFKVNPNVLIPRQETEELVHWIISSVNKSDLTIYDLGTGSGCIAISLKKELSKANVIGVDVSDGALELAQANSKMNSTEQSFLKQNILDENTDWMPDDIDVIVSNPPYVRESEKELIQNNVLNYEPHLALFVSNEDPLIFYRVIAKLGHKKLKPGGYLFFEINEVYGTATYTMLEKFDYKKIEIKKDLSGKDRMIRCQK